MDEPTIIPVLALLAGPAAACFIVWLIVKSITKGRDQRHAEKMARLQQGLPVSADSTDVEEQAAATSEQKKDRWTPSQRLTRGITTASVGAAITIFAFVIESHFWLVVGLVPLGIGVSLLPKRLITRGITMAAIGLVVTLYTVAEMNTTWLLAGLIVLFLGLSRIATHYIAEREKKGDESACTPVADQTGPATLEQPESC